MCPTILKRCMDYHGWSRVFHYRFQKSHWTFGNKYNLQSSTFFLDLTAELMIAFFYPGVKTRAWVSNISHASVYSNWFVIVPWLFYIFLRDYICYVKLVLERNDNLITLQPDLYLLLHTNILLMYHVVYFFISWFRHLVIRNISFSFHCFSDGGSRYSFIEEQMCIQEVIPHSMIMKQVYGSLVK
jgi:hypothetical protein